MADTEKSKDAPKPESEDIIDAEVIEESLADDAPLEDGDADVEIDEDDTEEALDDIADDANEEPIAEGDDATHAPDDGEDEDSDIAEIGDEVTSEDGTFDDTVPSDDVVVPEDEVEAPTEDGEDLTDALAEEPEEPIAPQPEPVAAAPAPVVQKSGPGFFPLAFGGVVAAALGFGAADYSGERMLFGGRAAEPSAFETETAETLASYDARFEELTEQLAATDAKAGQVDLSGLEGAIASVSGQVDGLTANIQTVSDRLDALSTKLTELEKRPVTEIVDPEIVAVYERELEALRVSIEAQRAEVENVAAAAVEAERAADLKTRQAAARAALAQIGAAIENGAGFSNELANLTEARGTGAPPALAAIAETGAVTQAELVDTFPVVARAALSTARKLEPPAEDTGGKLTSFLRTQLGARSVAPRDGDDADAVLSRAEAALKGGQLAQALAELETLPTEAQADLSDWLSGAQARLAAMTAVSDLSAELNQE